MWDMDWTLQSEAKSMLNQLGIVDHEQPLAELSGGQRRKAALVRTLVQDLMYCCWTSRPTIWIMRCSHGWKYI